MPELTRLRGMQSCKFSTTVCFSGVGTRDVLAVVQDGKRHHPALHLVLAAPTIVGIVAPKPLNLKDHTLAIFLGYDPGGRGKNGVAAIRVPTNTPEVISTATVLDASEALAWLTAFKDSAQAIGIDTLLAWSPSGSRACDNALRRKYGGNSVIAQNSLYSAMTLNGAIVAKRIGLPVYESHPKLLLRSDAADPVRQAYRSAVTRAGADHEADAVVAAWCAAMGYMRSWTTELFADVEDDIELVVPGARYPWFEPLA
jgi:predicted nuclease with RNAse H fold